MANLYRKLVELLPGNPLRIGTVVAAAGQELTIELDDGSKASARGSYSVGTRIFFRPGGAVEGEAPSIPTVDIAV